MGNSSAKKTIPIVQKGKAYKDFAEVGAEATAENKTLVVIYGQVYDLTKFKHEHPGGAGVLEATIGKDGSSDFADIGHTATAFKLMPEYIVGYIQSAWDAQQAEEAKAAQNQ